VTALSAGCIFLILPAYAGKIKNSVTPFASSHTQHLPGVPSSQGDTPSPPESLILPDGPLKEALRKYAPDFRIWRQDAYDSRRIRAYPHSSRSTPATVLGDFNGDGVMDAYLHGHDSTYALTICALSRSSGSYEITENSRSSLKDLPAWSYDPASKKFRTVLVFQPAGSSYACGGDMAAKTDTCILKYDGIAIGDIWRNKATGEERIELLEIIYWDEETRRLSKWSLLTDPDSDFPSGPLPIAPHQEIHLQ
jgi:hypothetical protein